MWQILQATAPSRYSLSQTACLGILRRAACRGKSLPPLLEAALRMQAGLDPPAPISGEAKAYHINQRNEGIDLDGVSGALMATQNLQMQTFITNPSSSQNGPKKQIAFAANQRDEVRDLHDVAGALGAQPGMKQQTFVAGFSAGAGASAGTIGYQEDVAPTLKGSPSGNCILFKCAVELNMLCHTIAAHFRTDPIHTRELRAYAVDEVKRTNGQVSFENAVRSQRRIEPDDTWPGSY